MTMTKAALAAVIERDLLSADEKSHTQTASCFMCGIGMMDRGSRFCSNRCRFYYDGGAPGYAQDYARQPKIKYGMSMGPTAFISAAPTAKMNSRATDCVAAPPNANANGASGRQILR